MKNYSYLCTLKKDMIKVQVINKGHQQLPAYATLQSAGMDLRAKSGGLSGAPSYGAQVD